MAKSELFASNQPGGAYIIARQDLCPGDTYFVDSNATNASDAAGYGKNPDTPFATWDYALTQATSGDVIFLLPGHAENCDSTGGITSSGAGIKTIGLGYGALRPTITMTTAESKLYLNAASNWVENILITFSATGTSGAVHIEADDITLKNVEIRGAGGAVGDFTRAIMVGGHSTNAANLADRCKIIDCTIHVNSSSTQASAAIYTGPACDGLEVSGCKVLGKYVKGCVHNSTGGVLTEAYIHDNLLWSQSTGYAVYCESTASAGVIANNIYANINAVGSGASVGNMLSVQNYHGSTETYSGWLSPASTTT